MSSRKIKPSEEQLQLLARKYFWEQKAKEIASGIASGFLILLSIIGCLFLIFLLGHISYPPYIDSCTTGGAYNAPCSSFFEFFINGLGFLIVSAGVGFSILLIILIISAWINLNKELALERAKEELGIK